MSESANPTAIERSQLGKHDRSGLRRLEIFDLDILLTVAELGSFRKASAALGLGQPTISRRIARLEDLIGVSLFERRATGARLTGAGWDFVMRARNVVRDFEDAVGFALTSGAGQNGHLRLGLIASLSQGVVRMLTAKFLSENPGVELSLNEAERCELLALLSHRRIDAVIASGVSRAEHCESFLLVNEQIYIAIPRDHPLAQKSSLTWKDAQGEHFVVSAYEPGPEIHDYLIRRLAGLGVTPRVARHRAGREGVMNLVGLGLGVSLVADHWRGVRYPNVAFIPIGDPEERIPFSLIWRPENDNPALRRFISLARIEAKRSGALS